MGCCRFASGLDSYWCYIYIWTAGWHVQRYGPRPIRFLKHPRPLSWGSILGLEVDMRLRSASKDEQGTTSNPHSSDRPITSDPEPGVQDRTIDRGADVPSASEFDQVNMSASGWDANFAH